MCETKQEFVDHLQIIKYFLKRNDTETALMAVNIALKSHTEANLVKKEKAYSKSNVVYVGF